MEPFEFREKSVPVVAPRLSIPKRKISANRQNKPVFYKPKIPRGSLVFFIFFMNIQTPSWDELFMRNVYLIASKSRDTSSWLGAVIVKDKRIISSGYNGLPQGIEYDNIEMHQRPTKYFYYEHGERNSIYSCARHGISSLGATLFTLGIPCADCARAIIQAGIKEVVYHKQWQETQFEIYPGKWTESLEHSKLMFEKSATTLRIFDKPLSLQTLMNGKLINV